MLDIEKIIKGLQLEREYVRRCLKEEKHIPDAFNNTEYLLNIYDCALELLKAQQWNRLTEDSNGLVHGLPGDDGQYLMTDGKDIWIDDYVDGVEDGVWLDSGRNVREIKAWMEMPELPED